MNKLAISLVLVFSFISGANATNKVPSNPSLEKVCAANKGTKVTGVVVQFGASHGNDNAWPVVHVLLQPQGTTEKSKRIYYFSSSGRIGNPDGYSENLLSIASQSRFFKEKVDVCVSKEDPNEIIGMENYPET
ncbi:TPA: hypothetical protein JD250_14120 [Proteus mirabilis]|nr:hypothetical protein [Proteus mirabilis]HAU5535641.1 hypothetical protein [Proteus mirabilis]HAU5539279.1 hypothetical protein [Proteus mirabilis]HAU5542715.1 hypothetical protein [Proteus mirabilis]HAU5573652.1 hypothetical protein [Proteus mirabilis]